MYKKSTDTLALKRVIRVIKYGPLQISAYFYIKTNNKQLKNDLKFMVLTLIVAINASPRSDEARLT